MPASGRVVPCHCCTHTAGYSIPDSDFPTRISQRPPSIGAPFPVPGGRIVKRPGGFPPRFTAKSGIGGTARGIATARVTWDFGVCLAPGAGGELGCGQPESDAGHCQWQGALPVAASADGDGRRAFGWSDNTDSDFPRGFRVLSYQNSGLPVPHDSHCGTVTRLGDCR